MNEEQKEYLKSIFINNGYSEANFYTICDLFGDILYEIRQEGYNQGLEDGKFLNKKV